VSGEFAKMLLIAAVCFAGINDGFAQTYSQGIIGYYNRVFTSGTNYFSIIYKTASNSLENLFYTDTQHNIVGAPEGTTISFWNPTNSSFDTSSIYTNGAWSLNLILTPGIGVMLVSPVTFTNTFVGQLYNQDGNLVTNQLVVLPPVFSKPPNVYLLGDACQIANTGTNVFLNILGRMPFPGEKVATVSTTSTYLGNGQWDVVPTLGIIEAAFFTTLPEPPPALSLRVANNQAIVSWMAYTSVWKLQTNASLNPIYWNDCGNPATNSPMTNGLTTGNLFFRLVPAN
jgi:hypothetical protein